MIPFVKLDGKSWRCTQTPIGIGRGGWAGGPSISLKGEPTYPLAPSIIHHIFLQCLCETVKKLDHKCTNLIFNICTFFILFKGISKSKLFNSILNFAILSVFNVKNAIIWHIGGGGYDQFTASKKFAPLASPPPPPIF